MNASHTIGVEIALAADFTYDADFGFAIGFERAESQFSARKTSLCANNNRFSPLGEHAAFAIAADEEDGNCNGHATDLFGTSSWAPGEGAKSLSTTMAAKKSMMAKEM